MDDLLQTYNEKDVNLLVPTSQIQQAGNWHVCRITPIYADTDENSADIFKVGNRIETGDEGPTEVSLFALAKPFLMRISAAAGLIWDKDSGLINSDKEYACYKAIGVLRLPDGSSQPIIGTKEIDLTVVREEMYRNLFLRASIYAASSSKEDKEKLNGFTPEDWANKKTDSAMIKWRKNKVPMAETGAMLRVIKSAFAMKNHYTLEELERPFIVPRIDFNPDYNDPGVKEFIISKGFQAMNNLYRVTGAGSSTTTNLRPTIEASDEQNDREEDINIDKSELSNSVGKTDNKQNNKNSNKDSGKTTPVSGKSGTLSENQCHYTGCGKDLSPGVKKYSMSKFNEAYCIDCQKKKAKELEGGAKK